MKAMYLLGYISIQVYVYIIYIAYIDRQVDR